MHLQICRMNFYQYLCRILLFVGLCFPCSGLKAEGQKDDKNADSGVAAITRFHGDVKVLSHPSKQRLGPSPHAMFEGKYYQLRKAAIGTQLQVGDVIQTGKQARARIVYRTGDQLTMASSSSYQILDEGKGKEKRAIVDLLFGKIRAMIRQRDQETETLEVRSKSMVMGVRGTDFFVAARNGEGAVQLTVLRGKVAVSSPQRAGESVDVPAGYSLMVQELPSEKAEQENAPDKAAFQVRPSTKDDVAAISQVSRVEPPSEEDLQQSERMAEVQKLEERALQSLKEDIKDHQPELYKKLQEIPAETLNDSDLLQSLTTKDAFEKAPNRPEKEGKSRRFDLDSYGDDVYEKYLKY
ncbi:MAG: FecR family protein [Oligoflexus sp.]